MFSKKKLGFFVALAVSLILAACGGGNAGGDAPVGGDPNQGVAATPEDMARSGAEVISAELSLDETMPGRIRVVVDGDLPTPCHIPQHSIAPVNFAGEIHIEMYSTAPADAVCDQVIHPFQATLAFDVPNLTDGEYTVWVNGETIGGFIYPEMSMSNPEQNLAPGAAFVDGAEVLVMESFPIQVNVRVFGNLPTPCNQFAYEVSVNSDNNQIEITVSSLVPTDVMCTQVLAPFDETISLDLNNFVDGTYTVWVNGVQYGEFVYPGG